MIKKPMTGSNPLHNIRLSMRYIKHPDIILYLFCQYVLKIKPKIIDDQITWPADPQTIRAAYGWQQLTEFAGKVSVWQLHQTIREGRCIDAVAEFKHQCSAHTRITFCAGTMEDAMMLCLVYQRKRGGESDRLVAKIPRLVVHWQDDLKCM